MKLSTFPQTLLLLLLMLIYLYIREGDGQAEFFLRNLDFVKGKCYNKEVMEIEQLKIENTPYTTCSFTGHRELGKDFSKKILSKTIEDLIKSGVKTFYSGMAMGFDLECAETVVKLKKKYDVKLIACIPFINQEKYYSESDKKRYAKLICQADEQVVLSEHFSKNSYVIRNKYLVEKGDVLIAYLREEKSGTGMTVRFFRAAKKGKIIFL